MMKGEFLNIGIRVGDLIRVVWSYDRGDENRESFTVVRMIDDVSVGGYWAQTEREALKYKDATPTPHKYDQFQSIKIVKDERKVDRLEFMLEYR